VRLGYLINAVFRGIFAEALTYVLDATAYPTLEEEHQRPMGAIAAQAAGVTYRLLARAEEARQLLDLVG
jgi:hypothetical protein